MTHKQNFRTNKFYLWFSLHFLWKKTINVKWKLFGTVIFNADDIFKLLYFVFFFVIVVRQCDSILHLMLSIKISLRLSTDKGFDLLMTFYVKIHVTITIELIGCSLKFWIYLIIVVHIIYVIIWSCKIQVLGSLKKKLEPKSVTTLFNFNTWYQKVHHLWHTW